MPLRLTHYMQITALVTAWTAVHLVPVAEDLVVTGDMVHNHLPASFVKIFANLETDRDRYPPREALPLPTRPPYTAHLGNLSFDATEGDIQDFFADCAVTNVRIIEDKMDRKPKGFAYVEYGTLEGLKKALEANGTQFQGRNIRVSVAEPRK